MTLEAATPVPDRDSSPGAALERALEQRRQIAQVLESSLDAFISLDQEGLVTSWNTQAEAVFGWSCADAVGRDLAQLIIPEVDREAHGRGIERFLATGEQRMLGRRVEVMALHRDGYEILVEMAISATETSSGYAFNAFVRDITERKRIEQELALARDRALDASRMKSMFVANMSHEIRTPMNGVIGMTELLLDTNLNDVQREYAQTISLSGEALLTLVEDILDLSKVEAGKLELDETDFNLRQAIERACGMLAPSAHAKGVHLTAAIDPTVPVFVHGDAARLRQVLCNFLSNAVKFTAAGTVDVQVTATLEDDDTARVRVVVRDTGIGIERRALKHLFKPFEQADSSTTRKYGGTGLGLAISRQLIGLMGGTVGADSTPGEGSTFWFELPLAYAACADRQPEEGRGLAGLRVLVVDDSANSRGGLERQLHAWRMSCQSADNATGALEVLRSAERAGIPFALVLLDLMTADDGYELAGAIRADPALSGLRVVVLAPPQAGGGGAAAGSPDRTLTKPVEASRLYAELQGVIANVSATAERGEIRSDADAVGAEDREKPLVLVVEDTPVNQLVAARMLENRGYRAHLAANGLEALEALSRAPEEPYVAVLMDCQMPELDGYETTREIRRLEQAGQRRIPIIAMTAHSMQGERERCLAAGMDDYMTKPLRKVELKDTLERWTPAHGGKRKNPGVLPDAARRSDLLDEDVIADLEALEEGLLESLLSLYFEEAAADLSALGVACAGFDADALSRAAHKLKGSSRAVGAAGVGEIASEIEVAAGSRDLTAAAKLVDAIGGSLDETRTRFAERSARSGALA